MMKQNIVAAENIARKILERFKKAVEPTKVGEFYKWKEESELTSTEHGVHEASHLIDHQTSI